MASLVVRDGLWHNWRRRSEIGIRSGPRTDRFRVKSPRAIRPAPRKQKRIGNPVPERRRRSQPRSHQTLLGGANFCLVRPSTSPTLIDETEVSSFYIV